jgi:hypothetical protein
MDVEFAQLRYLDAQPNASRRRVDLEPRHVGYTRRFLLAAGGLVFATEAMQ